MVQDGEIKRERIDESFARIMALKAKLAAPELQSFYQQELEKSNLLLQDAQREIEANTKEIKALEAQIQEQKSSKKSKKRNKS